MDRIDLNGNWELTYDNRKAVEIQIPCAVETVMEKKDYYGPFYFTKIFNARMPEGKKRAKILFEGVSYACEVFLNQKTVCTHEGVWDSFEVDVTEQLSEGENVLEVMVFKPDFDKNSPYYFRSVLFGFIPDVMMPFGGIWKDVELYFVGETYFTECLVTFSRKEQAVFIQSQLFETKETENLSVQVNVSDPHGKKTHIEIGYEACIKIDVENCCYWSVDTPNLYQINIELMKEKTTCDTKQFTGGFRHIQVENGEILLNGAPFYMRGILHWGCYPEKMTPNLSYEEVREELNKIKSLGFNAIKHCLYFPPKYYYELCDEMGIVTWQELPLWLPYKNEHLEKRIYEQYPKMLDLFMQHPGVSVVSIGCELDATVGSEVLNDLYEMIKEREEQLVICDNSGSGECFEGGRDAKSDIYDYHFYAELYNLNSLVREFTYEAREKKPWIFGEFNDSDTMRILAKRGDEPWWQNADEAVNPLRKVHKGFESDQPIYKQREIFEDYNITEEASGMEAVSRAQMTDIRKYILELTRSTPGIKGYNITTIQDVPITTAGIFDAAMNPKVSKEVMQQVNGEVVVSYQKDLARKWKAGADCFYNKDRYHYFEGEPINGRMIVSNRSAKPIDTNAVIRLTYEGEIIKETTVPCVIKANTTQELGYYEIVLPMIGTARRYMLEISLEWDGNSYKNQWDIWCYQKKLSQTTLHILEDGNHLEGIETLFRVETLKERKELEKLYAGDILLTSSMDETVRKAAERGIHVICMVKENSFLPVHKAPFYREGVIKIAKHPIMDCLLHKGYAGMQFFGIASSFIFDKKELEEAIGEYQTLMRRYDARKFHAGEYLIKYSYGKGTVLATTLNLNGGMGEQPAGFSENKQAAWLLHQMITYLGEIEDEYETTASNRI